MALILIVDDSPVICDVLTQTLELEGHSVLIADNGIAALGCMAFERPDIILLDVNMPLMNGPAFVKELELCHLRTCPIIVMTAGRNVEVAMRPEGVLLKPFHHEDLLLMLEQVLEPVVIMAKLNRNEAVFMEIPQPE